MEARAVQQSRLDLELTTSEKLDSGEMRALAAVLRRPNIAKHVRLIKR